MKFPEQMLQRHQMLPSSYVNEANVSRIYGGIELLE